MPKVGLACTETQLAEAREEGSSRGMAPLCPQPPHLPGGTAPSLPTQKGPCSGMRLPQGMGLHVPVQAQHVGFVAAWGPCCAADLSWAPGHSLPAQAGFTSLETPAADL